MGIIYKWARILAETMNAIFASPLVTSTRRGSTPSPRTRLVRAGLVAALLFGGTGAWAQAPVLVFAAASLKGPLDLIATDFETETGTEITISYAGSSALARQIQAGAPADVFLSANSSWMDVLADAGALAPDTRRDLLSNELVLIGHQAGASVALSADTDLTGLVGDGPLAMALVNAVPAGIYGKAALTGLGLWDGVKDHVVQTDSVRAALALVALGEAPFGIVYATDAVAEPKVTVLGMFPPDSHPPIIYPGAVMASSVNEQAPEFMTYLRSKPAADHFVAAGFTVLPTP
jgi:molybdate transport system substrate-binding protein